jgi:hypothetical protein
MNRSVISFILFIIISQAVAQVSTYEKTITASDLSRHLHILASDSLEGRETGMPGQKKAAEYIKNQFQQLGLQPPVTTADGQKSYFQKFTLVKRSWGDVYLKVGKEKKVFLKDFYAYGDIKVPKETKVPVVFGGYGINSPLYSDYKNQDIKGKAVVIFMGEPVKDGKSLVTGTAQASDWGNDWRKKASEARKLGAQEVLIVVGNNLTDYESRLNQLKSHIAQPYLSFSHKLRGGSALFISTQLAAELLKTTEENLLAQKEEIAQKGNNYKAPFKPAKITYKADVVESIVETENVLGLIEGTDKKDEVIVITAHYDHLGVEDGKIHYGADDDGSGTAALLEIAEAFMLAKQNDQGPRRSILIMAVTAEEKGLMGSEYYTDQPVFPLNKTIANLNVDMIGRVDEEHADDDHYVYIIGSDRLSSDLHTINEEANKNGVQLTLDYRFNRFDDPNRFYYRSDHYNFAKNNIPVIFYFSGVHEDYHKPTDTVDKILFDKAARITRLIFATAWELANREETIKVDGGKN